MFLIINSIINFDISDGPNCSNLKLNRTYDVWFGLKFKLCMI